jgi:TRAP-type uncharacterized transport system substrate-binding protein
VSGQIDFATVQADTQLGERINAVASLYFDAFQLIVNASSGIQGFKDLEEQRVAIAPAGSGQNRSFWFVAGHYGLAADQLTALPMSEEAANFAMIMGQVDAVFRVRAPGNPSIRELVSDHPHAPGADQAVRSPVAQTGRDYAGDGPAGFLSRLTTTAEAEPAHSCA